MIGNVEFRVVKHEFKPNIHKTSKSITFFYPGTSYNQSSPYLIILPSGKYKFECWGSKGTNVYGAYTAGFLTLEETKSFYLYLGSYKEGYRTATTYSYNGGGVGDYAGGGATDIRLIGGEWSDFISLKTRIMVAAGAGSPDYESRDGHGGDLFGCNATQNSGGTGGTQNSGGIGYVNGSFGKGGSNLRIENGERKDTSSGGGSGYYGGGTGVNQGCCGAGGGSSFISGYEGCDAINESSTEFNIVHTGQEIHYSGLFFTDPVMIKGGTEMPQPNGPDSIGYDGFGAVRISSEFTLRYFKCSIKQIHTHIVQSFVYCCFTIFIS